MKKLLILALLLAASAGARAQSIMVIETEKVFKSITAYNNALLELDALGTTYQKKVDDSYAEIEKMYNDYQAQKAYLSEAVRKTREDAIISREKEVSKYQEQIFGAEGQLIKARVDKMKPIQDKVFAAVQNYASANGFLIVIDLSSNTSVIYSAPAINKTDAIINVVKSIKF